MVDGGEAVSKRKRAFSGGQNSTLKKAVSEQRHGKSASVFISVVSTLNVLFPFSYVHYATFRSTLVQPLRNRKKISIVAKLRGEKPVLILTPPKKVRLLLNRSL